MYRFGPFLLEPAERRLQRDGAPVELSGRYLDALALLVRAEGQLVTKDRFMAEVWRGVPVTDEALTQCIRALRRQLGDDAARPRFIETVPKHGYRFIAAVTADEAVAPLSTNSVAPSRFGSTALAGTAGGTLAGAAGGAIYGLASAGPGIGLLSVVLVMLALTGLVALLGAAGVSFGLALGERRAGVRGAGTVVGAALGGLLVGALVRLVGLDAFTLLFGRSPAAITGGFEGVLLGAGVGAGVLLSARHGVRRSAVTGALCGGAAGLVVGLLGGRLMGGSLAALGSDFAGSHLALGKLGRFFGEAGFGPITSAVTATLEGALFGAAIAAAIRWVEERRRPTS